MDEIKIKAILLALMGKIEDLEASQAASIALLQTLSKGTLSSSDVRSAIGQMRFANQHHYEKLRKAIDGISS